LFREYAVEIRNCRPQELTGQTLHPWLDQVTLPLVIHALGGGHAALPPGYLDGAHSCHYRLISLLFARESDSVVNLLERVTAPETAQTYLPSSEQSIRDTIKATGLWLR